MSFVPRAKQERCCRGSVLPRSYPLSNLVNCVMRSCPWTGAAASASDSGGGVRVLPRGEALVLGGDLAYPNPSNETYETRLVRPFEAAMPPPPVRSICSAKLGCASVFGWPSWLQRAMSNSNCPQALFKRPTGFRVCTCAGPPCRIGCAVCRHCCGRLYLSTLCAYMTRMLLAGMVAGVDDVARNSCACPSGVNEKGWHASAQGVHPGRLVVNKPDLALLADERRPIACSCPPPGCPLHCDAPPQPCAPRCRRGHASARSPAFTCPSALHLVGAMQANVTTTSVPRHRGAAHQKTCCHFPTALPHARSDSAFMTGHCVPEKEMLVMRYSAWLVTPA